MSISSIWFRLLIRAVVVLFVLLASLPLYCQDPTQKPIAVEQQIYFPAAGCDNGKAMSNFALPLLGGAQPKCLDKGKVSFLPDRTSSVREESAVEVGTVIVLSISQQQAILAADSRVGRVTQGDFKGIDDTFCKLTQLTPSLLFAAAGQTKTSGYPANILYDAQQLALQAANNFVFESRWMEPNETIKEIAEKWAWDVAFRIRRGVLKRYYSPPDSGTWLIGVFSGLEPNGELSVAVARLEYHNKRPNMKVPELAISISTTVPPKDYTWIDAYGHSRVANKYIMESRKTRETEAEHGRIRASQLQNPSEFSPQVVRRLMELTFKEDTSQYQDGSKRIGGSIDIARIKRGGTVEWITHKQACSSRVKKVGRRSQQKQQ